MKRVLEVALFTPFNPLGWVLFVGIVWFFDKLLGDTAASLVGFAAAYALSWLLYEGESHRWPKGWEPRPEDRHDPY